MSDAGGPTRRVLLVEDDPNDVALTLRTLSKHGLANEVDVVSDGEQALDYLYRRGPCAGRPEIAPVVVLLDIKLPKVSGIEVLRQIKGDPKLSYLPVVMLTSSAEDRDLRECYRLGVNAYVVKPVNFQAFSDAVRQVGIFWAMVNKLPPADQQ